MAGFMCHSVVIKMYKKIISSHASRVEQLACKSQPLKVRRCRFVSQEGEINDSNGRVKEKEKAFD